MYPTIEALRQTSEAGVLHARPRFLSHEERGEARRAVSNRVRRGATEAEWIEIRY